ncbi:11177_t:CDS:2 [Gigaspora margarita]|uniref:11177_t:CDS:1 n=1 Tax=Gigaspora margarita TaxID=4874 RepID=A0ABM8VWU9_GIGMA|nr:11177_t:CDS:2 [Gigaspora margarita]
MERIIHAELLKYFTSVKSPDWKITKFLDVDDKKHKSYKSSEEHCSTYFNELISEKEITNYINARLVTVISTSPLSFPLVELSKLFQLLTPNIPYLIFNNDDKIKDKRYKFYKSSKEYCQPILNKLISEEEIANHINACFK